MPLGVGSPGDSDADRKWSVVVGLAGVGRPVCPGTVSAGDRWWWRLHKKVNAVNTAQPRRRGDDGNSLSGFMPQSNSVLKSARGESGVVREISR